MSFRPPPPKDSQATANQYCYEMTAVRENIKGYSHYSLGKYAVYYEVTFHNILNRLHYDQFKRDLAFSACMSSTLLNDL